MRTEVGIMQAHHKPTPPPIKHLDPPPASNPSAADARRERLGAIAICIWFFGGWCALFVLMALGVGPVVWLSGWLNRLMGSDSSTLAFAVAFGCVSIPVVVLQLAPWQSNSPFLRGAQRALRPNHDPGFVIRQRTSGEMSAWLLGTIRVAAGLSALSLIAGIGGYGLLMRAPADAGKLLQSLSPQQIIERRDHLPGYVTLATVTAGFQPNWLHLWSIRQTRYADLYFPIDPPSTRGGGPVRILGKVDYVPSDGQAPDAHAVFDVPIDGKLEIAKFPAWMRQRMAEHGFVVPDHVILFTPDDHLHGRFPGPDTISADFVRFLGISLAVVLAIASMILAFRRHRLLDTEPTP
jgi:hypothetical protein